MVERKDILNKANSIVHGDREQSYGSPENNFGKISAFWTSYLGHKITPEDVANMMILMKVARNSSGNYKDDNYIDICGYAAIGGELGSALSDTRVKPVPRADKPELNIKLG